MKIVINSKRVKGNSCKGCVFDRGTCVKPEGVMSCEGVIYVINETEEGSCDDCWCEYTDCGWLMYDGDCYIDTEEVNDGSNDVSNQ